LRLGIRSAAESEGERALARAFGDGVGPFEDNPWLYVPEIRRVPSAEDRREFRTSRFATQSYEATIRNIEADVVGTNGPPFHGRIGKATHALGHEGFAAGFVQLNQVLLPNDTDGLPEKNVGAHFNDFCSDVTGSLGAESLV
jgi:hypothetical protein